MDFIVQRHALLDGKGTWDMAGRTVAKDSGRQHNGAEKAPLVGEPRQRGRSVFDEGLFALVLHRRHQHDDEQQGGCASRPPTAGG